MFTGINDLPLKNQDDLLSVKSHVQALTNFIKNCEPPMTIAIQGDWGSGKTSVMHLVDQDLRQNSSIATVFFNTWTLSQFNLGDQLVVTLMIEILDHLNKLQYPNGVPDVADDKSIKIRKCLRVLQSFGKSAFHEALKLVPYGNAFDQAAIDAYKAYRDAEKEIATESTTELESAITALSDLRVQLQGKVDDICLQNGSYERIVFFIDDLDRLAPERAVELMEGMKNFLDLDHCVFVLAVDFSVVVKGVNSKYTDIDDAKARAFFDKIIQVPFRMPVDEYDLSKLISRFFEDESDVDDTYAQILSATVGSNPRSIKRVFNTFMLTKEISKFKGGKNKDTQEFNLYLFAGLCLQSGLPEFEPLFRSIVSDESPEENLRKVTANILQSKESELSSLPTVGNFDSFCNIIADRLGSDKGELDFLRDALHCTQTTSVDSVRSKKLVGTQLYHSNNLKESLEAGTFQGKIRNPAFLKYITHLSELFSEDNFTWLLRPNEDSPTAVAIRALTSDSSRSEKELLFTTTSVFNPNATEISFTLPLLKGTDSLLEGKAALEEAGLELNGKQGDKSLIKFDYKDKRPKIFLSEDNAELLAQLTKGLLEARLKKEGLHLISFKSWQNQS